MPPGAPEDGRLNLSGRHIVISGALWAFAFVSLEAVQFVFFGNVFQRIDSFLFAAIVFGVTTIAFVRSLMTFSIARAVTL